MSKILKKNNFVDFFLSEYFPRQLTQTISLFIINFIFKAVLGSQQN